MQCVLVFALVLLTVRMSSLPSKDFFRRQLSERTEGYTFDFFAWEWSALLAKLGMEFAAPQDTLSEAQRRQLVIDYIDALHEANEIRNEMNDIYSQLEGEAAHQMAAAKERRLSDLRSWLGDRQNLVEGILEEQVSTELEAEGFGRRGYIWPPVKLRFTELPLLLVISSRAEITRDVDVDLEAGIPLVEQEALEERVDSAFDTKRSLVTPIGGLSAYPAMILEHDSLTWLTDTFAHEWAHHFLIVYPLGYNYNQSGEMTSMNETTSSIVGREVGRRVILQYYPDLADRLPPLPVPPETPPMSAGELVWPKEPPPDQFDFNREMRKTRLRVDELLAAGQIEEAEAYMEERRLFFVEQGYNIRKINQAYFAFYGSYATNPSTGNPIGGQLEWLRAQSPTLHEYVLTIASVSEHAELLGLLARAQSPPEP
jgi:hypothetical protein